MRISSLSSSVQPFVTRMSTSGALSTGASLEKANAIPYSSMKGKIDPALLQGVEAMGFKYMTPVQEQVLGQLNPVNSDW